MESKVQAKPAMMATLSRVTDARLIAPWNAATRAKASLARQPAGTEYEQATRHVTTAIPKMTTDAVGNVRWNLHIRARQHNVVRLRVAWLLKLWLLRYLTILLRLEPTTPLR